MSRLLSELVLSMVPVSLLSALLLDCLQVQRIHNACFDLYLSVLTLSAQLFKFCLQLSVFFISESRKRGEEGQKKDKKGRETDRLRKRER